MQSRRVGEQGLGKSKNLELVPGQQSIIDAGVRLDQFHLGKDQASQPFNDMLRRLISSIVVQASVGPLLTNTDQTAEHRFDIDRRCRMLIRESS